ncbi:MAG: HAD hydrolase-like protein [Alphaproteobacteria bacterium]|jgi:2-haloacid dehalogenase|nr:HAD hydrolase-like protein [Rhodospirillaceae bacterium]MBT6205769.1 HAD hydrolase-like protein [Rhodospirillaceae bacterium]MBT6510373.1 HAD hydrolase-like protein [Rhodospirillaceae bacterium]MBT7647254.1 HAD hydrolase-like protein [Rhodospirillaceae bacterium]MDG2480639.1 HAD hydrolase-like protein [Alphaproteobacteria bacterium]
MRFRAVTFDCYGTLIDWDNGIGLWLENWASFKGIVAATPDLLEEFAGYQRAEQARTPFQPYRTVLGNALRAMGSRAGISVSDGEADEFAATAGTWPPFDDTLGALEQLKSQGRLLGVISNVDNDLFAGTQALLGHPFDIVITAQDVQSYKPATPHFDALRERLAEQGIGEDAILHVARSKFHDIKTANERGWANVWVNRRHGLPGRGVGLPSDAEPMWIVASMAECVALLAEVDPA